MKTKIETKDFRVPPGEKVSLKKWPTHVKPVYSSKKDYHLALREQVKELSKMQRLPYASDRYAVLLIFQAMDAAGKDGAIRHVMSGVNPQGCQVFSFKHPSATELDHDFLWRTTRDLPERGRIGIFNRSDYEEVSIVRVHPEILANERLPDARLASETIWAERYRSIMDLEAHLHRSGTRIIKFLPPPFEGRATQTLPQAHRRPGEKLEIHPGRPRGERMVAELHARVRSLPRGDQHQRFSWHVVPADDKKNARLIISEIILGVFKGLKMAYPKSDAKRRRELSAIRKRLDP